MKLTSRMPNPRIIRRSGRSPGMRYGFTLLCCLVGSWCSRTEGSSGEDALRAWRAGRSQPMDGDNALDDDSCMLESGAQCRPTVWAREPDHNAKLLVPELSFGGLSNRRQSLLFAAAAARSLNRTLVLNEAFHSPFPPSFGPCQRCVRPLEHYYDLARLTTYVPLQGYEDLFARLDASSGVDADAAPSVDHAGSASRAPVSVLAVCKSAGCMQAPPGWLGETAWDRTIEVLQSREEFTALQPVAPERWERVGRVGAAGGAEVVWLDTTFRLLDLGGIRGVMDGGAESVAVQVACAACSARCRSDENPEVAAAGWCDPACREKCEGSCVPACDSSSSIVNTSRIKAAALPEEFALALAHLDHSAPLKRAASAYADALIREVGGQYVCAHWRTGDWDVPMSASILLSSVAKVLASERREAGGADGAADGADGAGEGGASSRDSRESRVPRDSRGGGSRTVAVYLASDASDAQRALVARNLTLLPPISCKPPATGPWCQREGDWEEWEYDAVEDAILEQLVCAHAWVFIGTRGSTFSEAIVEERARRGFALASNYLVP